MGVVTGCVLLSSLLPSAAAERMTLSEWQLPIEVGIVDVARGGVIVGTRPNATEGFDPGMDILAPPSLPEAYIDSYLQMPSPMFGRMYSDIRSPMESNSAVTWNNLRIGTISGTDEQPAVITVNWPAIAEVPSEISFALLDPDDLNRDGEVEYDMRAIEEFRFGARANRTTVWFNLGLRAHVGTVIPPPIATGDVDGDGRITVRDATTVLRAAVNLVTLNPAQILVADVVTDSRIDIKDATQILRRAVGL